MNLLKMKNEYYKYFTYTDSLNAVKQNGYALQYVKNQTDEICLEAVKHNGFALRFVKNQTEDICIEAVKENGYALRFVDESCLTTVNEMTLDDVCNELGRNIKIIK